MQHPSLPVLRFVGLVGVLGASAGPLAAQRDVGGFLCPATIAVPATQSWTVSKASGGGSIIFGNITSLTRDSYNSVTSESWYLTNPRAPTTQWVRDTIWKWADAEVHARCRIYETDLPNIVIIDSSTTVDYPGGSAVVLQTRTEEEEEDSGCTYIVGCDDEEGGGGDGDGGGGGGGGGGETQWLICVWTVYTDRNTGQELWRTLDYCYEL